MDVIMTAPRLAPEAVAVIEAAGGRLHYMAAYPSAADVAALAAAIDPVAILTRQGPVNAAAMAAAPKLRIVARHGVGVDDVDLAAAAQRGILVARAPGSNTRAVAEHTLAMILALAKDLLPLKAGAAAGSWRGPAMTVRDLHGLRLGLLGFGGIGRAVAGMAAAFGMDTGFHDRTSPSTAEAARFDTLPALLARSDVLSIHLPLTPATRRIIDAPALALLPPRAYVVNTSRGGIIDEAALLGALDRGTLAGAALDVFEQEPPAATDPLRTHPRVLVTPHVSGVTDASLVAMGVMAAECIAAVLGGRPVPPDRLVFAPVSAP